MFTIGQTLGSSSWDAPAMTMAHWYHQKAKQCAQMAKDATDPRRRGDLQTEGTLWLEIAAKIEGDEVRRFGPEPD
jgi:hypothetical protein